MPIQGVPVDKLEERANFFEVAAIILKAPSFSKLSVNIDADAFMVAAEAYFFLNAAYKDKRIQPGSKTMPSKVGAMTALAIGIVQPLRPPSLQIEDEEYIYLNGALAMRLCCGVMKCRFDNRPFDTRRRWYHVVQDFAFPSLQPLLDEANAAPHTITTTYTPTLSADAC